MHDTVHLETNEPPEIELACTLTENDVYIFQKDHLRTTKMFKIIPTLYIAPLIISFISTAVILYMLEEVFKLFEVNIFFRLVLILVTILLSTYLLLSALKKGAKKQYEQDIEMQKPATYKFYKDKIIFTSEIGLSIRKFEEMHKFIESKNLFLIYLSENKAHIVPKRFFNNTEDINKTRELLSSIKMTAEKK